MMTGVERVGNILKREPVDRIAVYELFWKDTVDKWTREGHLQPEENRGDHFGFDIERCFPFNLTADLDHEDEVLEESEDTIVLRDGNGAVLRRHKKHVTTPEHIDFAVKTRDIWEERIRPLLTPDRKRVDAELYRKAKGFAAERNRFFLCVHPAIAFESALNICGHENLLMAMALEPEWVRDMFGVYTGLLMDLMQILFDEQGKPDGVYLGEDLGYKCTTFLSVPMYRELLMPLHRRIYDFIHGYGIPVIQHSCGFVEPLVPSFIEAGIDCLQPMEVKAGMDPVKMFRLYGEKISFMGGMDVTVMSTNDREKIAREIESKVPVLKANHGYILQSDHSVPDTMEYDAYRFFLEKGLEVGRY